jgi:hypothetical protein
MLDSASAATLLVHPDNVPYAVLERPYGRTLMKLVHVNVAQGTFTNIIKWEAGVVLPRHLHTGPVHAFTFEGRWRYLEYDWEATAGSYVYEPPAWRSIRTRPAPSPTAAPRSRPKGSSFQRRSSAAEPTYPGPARSGSRARSSRRSTFPPALRGIVSTNATWRTCL